MPFSKAHRDPRPWHAISFMAALFAMTSVGRAGTHYLDLPSSGGGATSWSTSVSTVGTGAGDTVATASAGFAAAAFSLVSSVYSLASNAYFDASALGAGTYTIGSTATSIDLAGNTFTVNA